MRYSFVRITIMYKIPPLLSTPEEISENVQKSLMTPITKPLTFPLREMGPILQKKKGNPWVSRKRAVCRGKGE
jgi:hypothetical protein